METVVVLKLLGRSPLETFKDIPSHGYRK
ncbi:hypothetical protein Gorai_002666 [Gossypium raimondii]|nr:hypothetical protein [Gossypium raimondii]